VAAASPLVYHRHGTAVATGCRTVPAPRPEIGASTTMAGPPTPRWLEWARELQAISQTGLTFARNEYDEHNFGRVAEIAAEITAESAALPADAVAENFRVQPGYATPKVDVRGAVVRDGRILLVQEVSDRRWSLPGGWADVGSYPAEMVAREVVEESGFEVRPTKVVGVFDCNRGGRQMEFYHAYKVIWLCEIVGGEARTSHETLAVDFFDFDDLPPLSPFRTTERWLEEIRAHMADPERPAAFD
jgi:ADP-ribose pyrophosphatase YjhB (NUDIX family)